MAYITLPTLILAAIITWVLMRFIDRFIVNRNTPFTSQHRFEHATMLYAVDGDTIDVLTSDGKKTRVRVLGIDAPESLHPEAERNCPAGEKATAFARNLCQNGMSIWLERDVENIDQYGRLLRHVWLGCPDNAKFADISMAAAMLKSGNARPQLFIPNLRHMLTITRLAITH